MSSRWKDKNTGIETDSRRERARDIDPYRVRERDNARQRKKEGGRSSLLLHRDPAILP